MITTGCLMRVNLYLAVAITLWLGTRERDPLLRCAAIGGALLAAGIVDLLLTMLYEERAARRLRLGKHRSDRPD